jgi:LacI family transcriptional regulator
VSESTASVVLNGARSGTRVSPTTRKSVMEAAGRLGYRPNTHAQSLLTGRSNRLGFYSGRCRFDSRNLFLAELLSGMLHACVELKLNTVMHTSGTDREDLLDLVSSKACDGLVAHLALGDPMLEMIGNLRVPAVAVADRYDELPSICVDDVAGGVLQARHLANLGHRRVLYLQAMPPTPSGRCRMEAFVEAAEELGMRVCIQYCEPNNLCASDIDPLIRNRDRATAVVAWSDGLAEVVCHKITSLGLSVPGDVAVVGFDGYLTEFSHRFEITTIHAPWEEVGRKAVSILMALISGQSVPAVTIVPVEFVRGTTT